MNAHIFNGFLILGWLLALAGGCLLNLGGGLLGGGLLLLAIVGCVARMAGVYLPQKDAD